jgi:hypothetical protein
MNNIEKVYKLIDARGTDDKNTFDFTVPETGTYRIGSIISSPVANTTLYFSILKKDLCLFASDIRHHTFSNNQTSSGNIALDSSVSNLHNESVKMAKKATKKQFIHIELKKGDILHGAYQLLSASASIGQVFIEKIQGLC